MIAWRLQWRVSPLFALTRFSARAASPIPARIRRPGLGQHARAPPLDGPVTPDDAFHPSRNARPRPEFGASLSRTAARHFVPEMPLGQRSDPASPAIGPSSSPQVLDEETRYSDLPYALPRTMQEVPQPHYLRHCPDYGPAAGTSGG
jgi:hypothetical protein